MKNALVLLFSSTVALTIGLNASAEVQLLRSAHELGDPSGYCLDIPGFGPRMRKDAPINTHTCKYNRPGFSVDEEFEVTESQQLRLPEYDLCLAAGSLEAGSDVFTIDCAKDNVHAWTIHANGNVTPSGTPALCLTLGSEKRYVNSSPGNLIPNSSRGISMQECDDDREQYQSWKWSGTSEQDTPTANSLRGGMDVELARGIRELGNVVAGRETAALYAKQERLFASEDVLISKEIAYGPDEGQRLQVYAGVNRNNPQDAAPIILLVHGGGFVRGGLNNFATAATQFAGLGYIAVNMTYPLAPNATWPSGSQNVAAAVKWIKENAADIKGNPNQIFVLGQSAGGAHVAEFVFRPSLVDGESPTVAGAILGSPAINPNSNAASAGDKAYYGTSGDGWANQQISGNIERTSIPVLIMHAELDPDKFHSNAARLLHELAAEKGLHTRFRQLRGHNHTSYMASVGTSDTRALQEILDFMATAGNN